MAFQATFDGVEDMRRLGRDLKAAGAKDLKKELLAAGRAAGKTAQGHVRAHAVTDLPKKNGLNLWVAGRARVAAQTRLTGKNVGLRLRIRHRGALGLTDLPAMNRGALRHPTFGDDPWVLQMIPPGFVYRAVDEIGDFLTKEFLQAVERVADKLAAGG